VKFIDEIWIFDDDIEDMNLMHASRVEVLVQNRSAGLMAHRVSSLD